jgi:hypothetical protein
VIAGVILAIWVATIGALVRRELFRSQAERMAQAALLVAPGALYYTLTRGDSTLGYATSTIDTSATQIELSEFLLLERRAPGGVRQLAARARANLTRGMRLVDFEFELGESYGPYRVTGRLERDSALTLVVTEGAKAPDTTRVPLRGPLMLPSTVPLALVLDRRPTVGQDVTYAIYDPMTGTIDEATVRVKAESLFVITDSASLETATARWVPAHQDTVRAWRLEQSGPGLLNGWVDDKGRLVLASPIGEFTMRRTAFEIAVQNWNLESKAHPRAIVGAPAGSAAPTTGLKPRHP